MSFSDSYGSPFRRSTAQTQTTYVFHGQPAVISRYNEELMRHCGRVERDWNYNVSLSGPSGDTFPRLVGDVAVPSSLRIEHVPFEVRQQGEII